MKRCVIVGIMLSLIVPQIRAEKKPWSVYYGGRFLYNTGLYWELNSGVLTISGEGPMIKEAGSHWLRGGVTENDIEKVIIENGVTTIDESRFRKYERLKSVVIAPSVTSIGARAFEGCRCLISISIPNSVSSIGIGVFSGCESLTSITIPNTLTTIPKLAFSCCSSLSSVTIPSSVTLIGDEAFLACKNLSRISIPSSVSSIGYDAFTKGIHGGLMTISKDFEVNNNTYSIVTEENTIPLGGSTVRKEMKCGLKDYTGKWTVPLGDKYSEIQYLTDHFIKVKKNNLYGLFSIEGKEIIPTEMTAIETAGNGYLRYKLNGFWGVMNYAGKIIINTDRGYTSIGDFKTFNKRFSYTMTGYKGECDATGRQISKIKMETPKQNTSVASSSGSSSSSSSSSNSNSGNNTTTIHVEHHRDPIPVQQWQACFACGGMGTMGCDFCGGSGYKYIGDRLHRCSRCNTRGEIPCNVCYGNKGQYVTVYK